jgi:F-type H+-transporting ATPase subunit b
LNIIPDWRVLIVQAGGFLLLLVVFKLFLFKPIMSVLDARRGEIEGGYKDAEARVQTAEELRAQYEQRLASVEEEIRGKITEAIKDGQRMREEILADSREKADGILTKAQEEIHREQEKAMVELKTTVADLAIGAAGKLIEEKLDPAKHRELVGRFIDNLDEVAK